MKKVESFFEALYKDKDKDLFSSEDMMHFADDFHNWMMKERTKDDPRLAGFDDFFTKYNKTLGIPRTDLNAAKKHWLRLTDDEKKRATDNIEAYKNSLRDVRYCHKARTYLSDKHFDDEFVVVQVEQKFGIKTDKSFDDLR